MNLWKLFVIVSLATFVVVFAGLTAFGAGGLLPDSTSLGGSTNKPGIRYGSTTNMYDNGNTANGQFWMSLDAGKYTLSSAYWNIQQDEKNAGYWTATCNLYGLRDMSQPIGRGNWGQSGQDPVRSSASLYYDCHQYEYEKLTKLDLGGSLDVAFSVIDSSWFNYYETMDTRYVWDKYQGEPTIVQVPSWHTDFNLYGHRMKDSAPLGVADYGFTAMSEGTQPVPEPSTWVMMLSLAVGGLVALRRNWLGC